MDIIAFFLYIWHKNFISSMIPFLPSNVFYMSFILNSSYCYC